MLIDRLDWRWLARLPANDTLLMWPSSRLMPSKVQPTRRTGSPFVMLLPVEQQPARPPQPAEQQHARLSQRVHLAVQFVQLLLLAAPTVG
jgi:hypothetical protein